MNETRRKRIALIFLLLLGVGSATAVALVGLGENVSVFYSPSDLVAGKAGDRKRVRVGGVVKEASVRRDPSTVKVSFKVTDRRHCLVVNFDKILPDLFREGDSVIVTGEIVGKDSNGLTLVKAEEVLAKHDENYMPAEVQKAMADSHQAAQTAKAQGQVDCTP